MSTAEQKIRETITGSPVGEPHFEHEGEDVVRWITGGTLPDLWVTFHPRGVAIEARCASCKNILGTIPADFEREKTAQALLAMRMAGHELHRPVDWP